MLCSDSWQYTWFLIKKIYFIIYVLCVCCMSLYVPLGAMARGQERATDPLALELQAVVSCPVWMLGTWGLCKSSERSEAEPSLRPSATDFWTQWAQLLEICDWHIWTSSGCFYCVFPPMVFQASNSFGLVSGYIVTSGCSRFLDT